MIPTQNARMALRAATRGEHDRVDAVFAAVDLGDASTYRRFLLAQGAAHLAVEAALDAAGAERVLPDWPARRRGVLLRADLNDLGVSDLVTAPPPAIEGQAAVFGAVYVLEGSRLGGQVLKRSVGQGLPVRFLGASDPAGWRRLLDMLDEFLSRPEEIATGIKAAREVFGVFERCGLHYLRTSSVDE
jgi:heme oxygenase